MAGVSRDSPVEKLLAARSSEPADRQQDAPPFSRFPSKDMSAGSYQNTRHPHEEVSF